MGKGKEGEATKEGVGRRGGNRGRSRSRRVRQQRKE